MKINEIVTEAKLRKGARRAIPGLESYPGLDNNNNPYLAYRFGIELAGSPNSDRDVDDQGGWGSEFATIAYTEGEREIIDHAKKKFGIPTKKQSNKKSSELDKVNKTSPVAQRKKNKYGV
jgi:hypothetical protein